VKKEVPAHHADVDRIHVTVPEHLVAVGIVDGWLVRDA
jgi:hypothetical protein